MHELFFYRYGSVAQETNEGSAMKGLVLTIGDPQGIGPEITAKALHRLDELPDTPLTIIGNREILQRTAEKLGLAVPQNERIAFRDIAAERPGECAYLAIESAMKMIAAGEAEALVTGPISKKNLQNAGYDFPGHTEILERLTQRLFEAPNARAEMLFAYKNFRLLLLTRHITLRDVSAALAVPGAVARPIKTLIQFLRHRMSVDQPRIALLGVNPHAGEINGDEEQKIFAPLIKAVNAVGASKLEGCFASDAFFRGFDAQTTPYDAIVAAYHDQGLIPFKLLAGYDAVNLTIGLPFLRTSVSHGTAEDIVGKGIAREDSLMEAIRMAANLTK
jgi:4-hydroxythreonine-4-phosphate dehydrogenase